MKLVNEKLEKQNGVFDEQLKEILDTHRGVVADALMGAIKRPGRQPRLTNAIGFVPPPKEVTRYRLPNKPLTLEEIGYFLSHPEELEIVKDDKDGK